MPRATIWVSISQEADAVENNSDKTLTVPSGRAWRVGSIAATLVTTDTEGNRQLDVLITDGSGNVVAKYVSGAVQAASLTRVYVFAPSHPQETGFTNGLMLRSLMSNLILPATFKIRVYDSAAIDPSADDMTVRLLVETMSE